MPVRSDDGSSWQDSTLPGAALSDEDRAAREQLLRERAERMKREQKQGAPYRQPSKEAK